MNIASYGVEQQILPGYRKPAIDYFNKKLKEKVTDKKVKATFNILVRYKNNSKFSNDCNNETLSLAYDINLSTDLIHTEIDFATGRSLTISLLESNQRSWGRTQLLVLVQYINEKQELFQNIDYHYCPTLPGTLTRRLQGYKVHFDELVEQYLSEYRESGFRVNRAHTVRNIAGYLYYENKRRAKPFLSPMHTKLSINKILTIFSVLHDDCFWTDGGRLLTGSLHDTPYYDQDNSFGNIHPTYLPVEQVQALEQVIKIIGGTEGLENLFSACHKDYKFQYVEFKHKFLQLLG